MIFYKKDLKSSDGGMVFNDKFPMGTKDMMTLYVIVKGFLC